MFLIFCIVSWMVFNICQEQGGSLKTYTYWVQVLNSFVYKQLLYFNVVNCFFEQDGSEIIFNWQIRWIFVNCFFEQDGTVIIFNWHKYDEYL